MLLIRPVEEPTRSIDRRYMQEGGRLKLAENRFKRDTGKLWNPSAHGDRISFGLKNGSRYNVNHFQSETRGQTYQNV